MPLIRMEEPAAPKTFPSAKGSMVSIVISLIAMAQLLQNAFVRGRLHKPNGGYFIPNLNRGVLNKARSACGGRNPKPL